MRLIPYILLFISLQAFGQNDPRIAKIDNDLNKKLTGGEYQDIPTIFEGINKMDSLLNVIYKEALNNLTKEDKEALRKSQRAWLVFYNSEQEFITNTYACCPSKYEYGSSIRIISPMWIYKILRQRVEILSDYANPPL